MAGTMPAIEVLRPDALASKRANLTAGGAGELLLVLDFDHTITTFTLGDGRRTPMCHDVVEKSPLMPQAFRDDYDRIWAEQKEGIANGNWSWERWWRRSHEIMADHGLQRQWLPEMVKDSGIVCRPGCHDLFELANALHIPVLIVSAGISDIIVEVMTRENLPLDNVRILANRMVFDEATGLLRGFEEPALHSHGKADVGLWEKDYFESLRRKHVLLVGDSPRDVDCLEKVPGLVEDIRVGLYNPHERASMRSLYEDSFDMLLSRAPEAPVCDVDLAPLLELFVSIVGASASIARPLGLAVPLPKAAPEAAAEMATAEAAA